MEGSALFSLVWILLAAALTGMLAVRFRVPPVVGLLFSGMLVGPNLLNLVDTPTIDVFAEIGAVLLLFMIGVEFSVTKLLSAGLRAIISSLALVLTTFTVMHEVSILLGFDALTSLFMASMFSMSSTAIMMKILEQKQLVKMREVPVLVTMLIIEDIVAVFLLTFFSSLKSGTYDADGIIGAVIVSLGMLAFGYFILLKALNKLSSVFLRYQADDTLIMFAFSLGLGMSALASFLNLTPAIGAFLAGSMLAALPNGHALERAIRPFSHLFSSFFFLSIGMLINPWSLLVSYDTTLLLIASFMAVVFLATVFAFYIISYSGRSSAFAGLAMLPLGEFSLLIAKEGSGMVETNLVGIASLGVLITSLACSVSISRSEKLYRIAKGLLPGRYVGTIKDASGYFRNVISAFEPDGHFHRLMLNELRRVASDLLFLFGVVFFYWILRGYAQSRLVLAGISVPAEVPLLLLVAALSLLPLVRLLMSFKRMFDALSTIFSRTTPVPNRVSLVRNVLIGSVMFLVFANTSLIVGALQLPEAFNWFSVLFGVLSLFFFWAALRASSFWVFLSERKTMNIMHTRIVLSNEDIVMVSDPHPSKVQKKWVGGRKKKFAFIW